jgi:hypothetical protein
MLLQYSKGTWPWKIMDYASFRSIWCNDFWFPCWTCVFPSHFFATGNMIIMIGLAGSYQWLPVESLLNQWVTHDNLIKQPLDQRHIFSQCHGFIWIVRVNHHQWIMYIYILSYWLLYNNISRTLTMTMSITYYNYILLIICATKHHQMSGLLGSPDSDMNKQMLLGHVYTEVMKRKRTNASMGRKVKRNQEKRWKSMGGLVG